MKKRLIVLMVGIVMSLSALTLRLIFIQVIDTEKYASVTSMQQRIRLDGTDDRGVIYDRNMKPLIGDTQEYVYIIQKKKEDKAAKEIFQTLKARKVANNNGKYDVYSSELFDRNLAFRLRREYEVFMLKADRRYAKEQPAVHLIGYINEIDGKGVRGLEKDFNDALTKREKKIYAVADAAGNIIPGQGITAEEKQEDSGIITSLDIDLQKKAEEIMSNSGYKGAMVVLDVQNGEVVASVSEPSYHPYEIQKYLNSDNSELLNRATQSLYPPGSTFKIIVAAAALEKGIATPETTFYCQGYEEINGVRIKCSNETGHGTLTLKEGFAKSCNCVFIQLGSQLGGETILQMARSFGIGEKVLADVSEEEKGNLPTVSDTAGAGIGNLSIGQGSLLMTPLQVAYMTKIIANNGWDNGLTLVKGISCEGVITTFQRKKPQQIISEETAQTITSFMEEVVLTGTANNLQVTEKKKNDLSIENFVKIAGKTGSAQTGPKENELIHGWFTGFFPADQPQYVITVLVENGGSGRGAAIPLFQQMAQEIENLRMKGS